MVTSGKKATSNVDNAGCRAREGNHRGPLQYPLPLISDVFRVQRSVDVRAAVGTEADAIVECEKTP